MHSKHNSACSILIWVLAVGVALLMADVQAHARIAFVSERDGNKEIYVMNADGSNLRNLTRNPARDSGPAWSPNGEHIAFDSSRGGNNEIYVMDVEGGNLRNLTNDPAYDVSPSWSPDGKQIAFASAKKVARPKDRFIFDIYVMDIDGGNLQKLTKDAESDYYPDWARSVFAVSPASKQLIIWGWLKSESR